MSHNLIQVAFTYGELSPALLARVDLKQYRQGAATMRNFFVDYRAGAASTRQGTKFVTQCKSLGARLIPFQTSVLVPYVLEFGDHYVRPVTMGASVLEPPFNITHVTQATPAVVTVPGHNFVPGDWVFITGVSGMIQIDNQTYQIINVSGNDITLAGTQTGAPINSLGYTPYAGGGTVGRIYQFTSPYALADLSLVKYVQIANTMYLVHPSYPPYILTFIGPTNWSFAPITFGTTVGIPTGLAAVPSAAGAVHFAYRVTAVDAQGQEGVASAQANCTSVNIGTTAGTIRLTWAAVPGAASYNIYKAEPSYSGAVPVGAGYGFVGSATGTTFDDTNIVPDFVTSPPIVQNPFVGNNPQTVCFFQQRLWFGGSNQFPQTFWASQPGFYTNFNVSDPPQEDDAITGTLVSRQVNAIKWMVPMPGGLLIGTAGGTWQVSSGQFGSSNAVTPINATAVPQAYYGASDVPPVVIGADVLFVQRSGIVRDLSYSINQNVYTGADISILSNHLFFGYQIAQWAYAEEPFRAVWGIRNDGQMLCLTYVKEQEMLGWSRHDTLGQFKSVCSVLENALDSVYVTVRRVLRGTILDYVERMAERVFPHGAEDAWSVDMGSQSFLPMPYANLAITNPSGEALAGTDFAVFTPNSVGMILRAGGGIARVTTFISATQVLIEFTRPLQAITPDDPTQRPLPISVGEWSLAPEFTTFYGLDYLEGQLVQILADGNVITPQVVTNGSITLAQPASKVIVGLAYTPQLQTMYLDMQNELDSIQGKRKSFGGLSIRVRETRGLSYGQVFEALFPIKEFNQGQVLGSTIELITGDEYVHTDPRWDVEGQLCLQQDNPLPATVLGVIPEVDVGDNLK
jgi:hypothetical protein